MDGWSTRKLDGQVAIVTGGSSGIGLATSEALAMHGAHVVLVGRNDRHVRSAVQEVHGKPGRTASVVGLTLDVRLEEDMNEMVRITKEQFGHIDLLVACAGVGTRLNSSRTLPR